MNKKELIEKIKTLTDLTDTERAHLIELVNTKKKYGLVWEDKPEEVEEQMRSMLPVLKEVKAKEIVNGAEHPNHILIEGDNLHALTALTYTHEGKIDVIYIDPPYNTGKKDFRYNDTFKDEYIDKENPFRHSTWLSFMNRRLNIAKSLLSEKGIVFISIDDNEQSQSKLLCDEIFNNLNFICQFIHKNNSNKNQAKLVGISTEYVLCYAKNKSVLKEIEWKVEKKGAKDIINTFKKLKREGFSIEEISVEISHLYKRPKYVHLSRWNKVNENGVFVDADLSREGGSKNYTIINPKTGKECLIPNRGWGKSLIELKRLQSEDLIWYGDDNTPPRGINYILDEELTVPDSFLYFDNSVDTKWQKEIFGKIIFENPKPVDMIMHLVKMIPNKNQIVLDFFAGSGTTLHATMALNAEDGGNRQCILVTNNENNICEEVTYERNKRVIEGYTNAKSVTIDGLKNNNLRYYIADFVPSERTEVNRRKLTLESTDLLRIKEDCFTNVSKEYTLNEKEAILFTNGLGKFMLVVYHSRNQMEVVEKLTGIIPTIETTEKIKLYAFSPEKETIEADFLSVADNIEAVPLPDSIYNAYRATFRTLKLDKKQVSPVSEPITEQE